MGKRLHFISDVDNKAMTAVCAHCGLVTLARQSGGRVRCGVAVRASKVREKILAKYGLSWDSWHALLIEQSGRCGVCEEPMIDPYVDHDHESGAVRGLLCQHCNFVLGHARDRVDILQRAIVYLRSAESPSR